MKNMIVTVQEDGVSEQIGVQWSATGLLIPETATVEGLCSYLRGVKAVDDLLVVGLADIISFARRRGWEEDIEKQLEQCEFEYAQVRTALAVEKVPRGLRHPKLTAEHYHVVSEMIYEDMTKWLARAVKHKMSPLVLKRSIEAGKVLSKEQIDLMSGSGSGFLTYGGILTDWKAWERKVGGIAGVLEWPREVQARWLNEVRPVVEGQVAMVRRVQEVLGEAA